MYDNIAKTIKTIALVLFIVGVIASIILGINCTHLASGMVILLIGGIVVVFISSVFIYGFGEIIDILDDIRYNTKRSSTESSGNGVSTIKDDIARKERVKAVFKSTNTKNPTQTKRCPHCGEIVTSDTCGMCGKKNNLYD